ncbi:MAG: enoyl-CoA hydratase/isomerase family protein [Aeromicrobium sp.]|uniref:enoyl-CoA hydratase/isomerase family protein n=1 Tax=Aeromicrobium sp. TaxID=1871063 RepID=UPI0026270B99|nr:enoyl-CoA hydratase/isomerase family protein [Aeromicrobium sp.]MDF1704904.1 enoyl-CoA hydratase/isomerase family protein [Aeromicrobium sp.]
MSEVLVEQHGAVVLATIDRPQAFNALDAGVVADLCATVVAAEASESVRAVVVTGSGTKAFSAGADLKELAGMSPDRAHATMRAGQDAFRRIEEAQIPVIAAVNGLALGGGFELALAATFPVLSTRAALGLPESSLGLIPGYGGTQRLPRAVGRRVATHLMLTGERLGADRAFSLGITPVPPVEPERLVEVALEIAGTIAQQGPQAVRSILHAVMRGADGDLSSGLALETGLAALAIAGAESTEGISAFLDRRPASFSAPGGDA